MTAKHAYARRRYLINKKFQLEFSIRFLLIIALAAVAIIVLFYFNSRGTMTAGYTGSEVKLLQTSAYFLPSLIVSAVGVIFFSCIAGIVAMIYISHRFAGPIFRFQAVLEKIEGGDLTTRCKLRERDQFRELENGISALVQSMDEKVGAIQAGINEVARHVEAMPSAGEQAASLQELQAKISALEKSASIFKTSRQALGSGI